MTRYWNPTRTPSMPATITIQHMLTASQLSVFSQSGPGGQGGNGGAAGSGANAAGNIVIRVPSHATWPRWRYSLWVTNRAAKRKGWLARAPTSTPPTGSTPGPRTPSALARTPAWVFSLV
jgi:hypothetical protein